MTDKSKKLQSLLNFQIGKSGLRNIVAAVQSYDKSLDFVGAAGVADSNSLPRYFSITPLPEFVGYSGSTGSFAFACPSRSLYITGTLNVINPSRPFVFMMKLVRATG